MSDKRDPLEDLLASIADGTPVNWDTVTREAPPGDRARIEALGDVSRIAAFSRSLQQGGEPFVWGRGEKGPRFEMWGDLLLLERLSGGTRTEVYRAWDTRLQREVALKLIRPGSGERPVSGLGSLLEEGRVAAKVRHPHVVSVHGADERDGSVGFWMEFLRGANLEQEVAGSGPLDPVRAARLGREIGSALAAVHAVGLLHRDVKPANIVRGDPDRYVLADFGLGQAAERAAIPQGPSGTPMYMAPELFATGSPSERSDVYALGMTLWFALAGRHPFRAGALPELIAAVEHGPAPLRGVNPHVPKELEAVVTRATARRPEDRFGSAGALVQALEALDRRPSSRGRRWAMLAGTAGMVLVVALAFWSTRSDRVPGTSVPLGAPVPDPAAPVPGASASTGTYDVEASFLKHDAAGGITSLVNGDRVAPGDRLSLRLHVSKPVWVYVLNEDERGEHYLLFPQPRFDLGNPIPAGAERVLPGTMSGEANAWTVTSAGGREHLWVAVSPEPLAELEAQLVQIPAAQPGRPVVYPRVDPQAVETLRGVGGVSPVPAPAAPSAAGERALAQIRALAGRESGVRGVWVRRITLENPAPPR